MKRGTVAHILQFSSIPSNSTMPNEPPTQFYLVNCHLFWDPRFPDVKLQQAFELMKQLEKEEYKLELPAVICGDFNSEPTSAV